MDFAIVAMHVLGVHTSMLRLAAILALAVMLTVVLVALLVMFLTVVLLIWCSLTKCRHRYGVAYDYYGRGCESEMAKATMRFYGPT